MVTKDHSKNLNNEWKYIQIRKAILFSQEIPTEDLDP